MTPIYLGALEFTKILSNPFGTSLPVIINPVYAVDDNSIAFVQDKWTEGNSTDILTISVIDVSGAVTKYSTGASWAKSYQANLIPLAAGNFYIINDATGTMYAQVRNLKLNNGAPIPLKAASTAAIYNPCLDVSIGSIFFDSLHNLVGVEFVGPGDEDQPIYSNTYGIAAGGSLALQSYGYVGQTDTDTGYNPYIQIPQKLSSENLLNMSNGISVTLNPEAEGAAKQYSLVVHVDAGEATNSCNQEEPNGSSVTASAISLLSQTAEGDPSAYSFDSNVPGLSGFATSVATGLKSASALVGVLNGFPMYFTYSSSVNSPFMVLTNKYVFAWDSTTGNVYVAPYSGFPTYPAWGGQASLVPDFLANMARPISLTGRYQS